MAPNARRIWTPRSTLAQFRVFSHSPKIVEYRPPPPPPSSNKKTPTTLSDPGTQESLRVKMAEWEASIAALEAENAARGLSLKEQLAELMCSVDAAKQAKMFSMVNGWAGDGTITRGEWLMNIRTLGIRPKQASDQQVDDLFNEWDADKSEFIEADELKAALKRLRTEWLEAQGKAASTLLKKSAQGDMLRRRLRAAKDAMTAHAVAEQTAAELQQVVDDIARRLDIQLGGLLSRRGMRAGELVGSWQGVRPLPRPTAANSPREGRRRHAGGASQRGGNKRTPFGAPGGSNVIEHRDEITLGEFIKGVQGLGLMVGPEQQPAPPAKLQLLFESIDVR